MPAFRAHGGARVPGRALRARSVGAVAGVVPGVLPGGLRDGRRRVLLRRRRGVCARAVSRVFVVRVFVVNNLLRRAPRVHADGVRVDPQDGRGVHGRADAGDVPGQRDPRRAGAGGRAGGRRRRRRLRGGARDARRRAGRGSAVRGADRDRRRAVPPAHRRERQALRARRARLRALLRRRRATQPVAVPVLRNLRRLRGDGNRERTRGSRNLPAPSCRVRAARVRIRAHGLVPRSDRIHVRASRGVRRGPGLFARTAGGARRGRRRVARVGSARRGAVSPRGLGRDGLGVRSAFFALGERRVVVDGRARASNLAHRRREHARLRVGGVRRVLHVRRRRVRRRAPRRKRLRVRNHRLLRCVTRRAATRVRVRRARHPKPRGAQRRPL